jgi:hypothetical protein
MNPLHNRFSFVYKKFVSIYFILRRSTNPTGCIGCRPWLDGQGSFTIFFTVSNKVVTPMQLSVQRLPGLFPRGQNCRRVKLTIRLHRMPGLRIGGALSPTPLRHHGVLLKLMDNFTFYS